jgi:predicted MFS family arabinose efflux permease
MSTGSSEPLPSGQPTLNRRYALYVLVLLTVLNFVNYVDRQVIVSMYDELRAKFGFSNGQIGALTTAFFIIHAVTTIPFGWMADQYNRRRILALAVLGWSIATLGSAYAVGFLSLLCLRAMVGVGEAAYGPVANSVLAESFPSNEKARVIAIFNGGMFAGACLGIYLGSVLGFPDSFLWIGYPGIILGLLAWNMKIPARRPGVAQGKFPGMAPMLRQAWSSINVPTLRWMLVSGVLISFAVGGYITWFVDFVSTFKHLPKADAAKIYGGIAITGGVTGVIAGGFVADWLYKRSKRGRLHAIALGFFAAVPLATLAIYMPIGTVFYLASWLMMFFLPFYNGPMAAVIDDVVDDDKASTAQASFSFFLHLLGSGPSAITVGFLSDYVNLQNALMLPTVCILLSAIVCLYAARFVEGDMEARRQRALVRRRA